MAVFVPSPHILALASTLVVHPSTTHRAVSPDAQKAADLALRYLYQVNTVVGPLNANFISAFDFIKSSNLAHGIPSIRKYKKRKIKTEDDTNGDNGCASSSNDGDSSNSGSDANGSMTSEEHIEGDNELVELSIAKAGGLFASAESFWHAVGWTFNCSLRHPHRYRRWKLWLGLMLQALEDDWSERLRIARLRNNDDTSACVGVQELQDSIIMHFLGNQANSGRAGRRKVLRAILADGGARATAEFGEVFHRECETKKKQDDRDSKLNKDGQQKRKLDIDEGEFGDYFDDDDDAQLEEEEDVVPKDNNRSRISGRKRRIRNYYPENPWGKPETSEVDSKAESGIDFALLGGAIVVQLRRQLLALVSPSRHIFGFVSADLFNKIANVAAYLPAQFTGLEELLEVYTEFLRPLSLEPFSLIISPISRSKTDKPDSRRPADFPDTALACLHQMVLRPLLPKSIPPYAYKLPDLATLQSYYLPSAAISTSVLDNAKVVVVLESLIRVMFRNRAFEDCDGKGLLKAHKAGVQAREQKTSPEWRRKRDLKKDEDSGASSWMEDAEQRLRVMVDLAINGSNGKV